METLYKPEGNLLGQDEIREIASDPKLLEKARVTGRILEGRAVICDSDHNLIVDFGGLRGIIPREEAAIGISDGTVRDIAIITRVNKPVCFKVTEIVKRPDNENCLYLSRKAAQEECRRHLFENAEIGDIVDARITHMEPFGAFADVGCGMIALLSIDNISVSRISHPSDRFSIGQYIKAVISDIDRANGRICLTHKELLGTWEENAASFSAGQTVAGIIRSVEDYGVFVELAPNLAGLAEYREGLSIGQSAAVYIKSIIPEKMKIKLSVIDAFKNDYVDRSLKYFITSGHLSKWTYSPKGCDKIIETVFS
ncbi:MAG: S1 RNA-binding domain-containing protein [Clostridia bacterium]|nr:S1 RNA-binding domain-containing protein [Clostridia bacterium]